MTGWVFRLYLFGRNQISFPRNPQEGKNEKQQFLQGGRCSKQQGWYGSCLEEPHVLPEGLVWASGPLKQLLTMTLRVAQMYVEGTNKLLIRNWMPPQFWAITIFVWSARLTFATSPEAPRGRAGAKDAQPGTRPHAHRSTASNAYGGRARVSLSVCVFVFPIGGAWKKPGLPWIANSGVEPLLVQSGNHARNASKPIRTTHHKEAEVWRVCSVQL